MTQFESWQAVLGAFICLNIIQFVVGSYVERRSPAACCRSHLSSCCSRSSSGPSYWGIFGSFIGVPITLAISPSPVSIPHPMGERVARRSRARAESKIKFQD